MNARALTTHLLLISGLALALFPFAWMISTSLKTEQEAAISAKFLPENPQFSNYPDAWNGAKAITAGRHTFARLFLNSLWVALWVTAGVTLSSCLAGYAFGCMSFPGKKALFAIFLATMMVPFEVALVPNFLTIKALGLYDTYRAMIFPWVASAFSVFLVRQYMMTIPRDYFDAARIDGCGHPLYLLRVAAPMASPALATVALFAFLGSWNAFLWPLLVIEDPSKYVVQYGLSLFVEEESSNYPLLMAASAMVIAPVVFLYCIAQRQFVSGVSAVGLKG